MYPEYLTSLFVKAEEQGTAAIDAKRKEVAELKDALEAADGQTRAPPPPLYMAHLA